MSFFAEIRRRNVVRVGLAYVVVGWVLAQVAEFAFENFGTPEWVLKTFTVLLLLGLPLALFFAWAFEVTPEGIKLEKDVDRSQSIVSKTGRKLDFIIIAALVVALAGVIWDSYLPSIIEQPVTEAPSALASGLDASIAVLPFVNMSNDPDQEYFADGMTEEILNTLAAIKELRVAGRTSSFMFKDRTDVDFETIGEQLNVAHVLEGSVRKSGNKLRITAQLIAAESGYHLWSETYDREIADIFEIQEELATAIGEELQLTLGVEVAESIEARRLDDEGAYEELLRGRAQIRSSDYESALKTFAKLNELEPEYLPAYSAKAHVYLRLLNAEQIDAADGLHALQEILRTVTQLDRESAERYLISAFIFELEGHWSEVVSALEKAADSGADYNDVLAYRYQASLLSGRDEQAEQIYLEYLASEPLDYEARSGYAMRLAQRGRIKDAEIELSKLIGLAPSDEIIFNMNFEFDAWFRNRLASAVQWGLKEYGERETAENSAAFMLRVLLDLGDIDAVEKWVSLDHGLIDYPYAKRQIDYLIARQKNDDERALALAHEIRDALVGLSDVGWYVEDLDFLRLLQRHNPEAALSVYEKRTASLTTEEPVVFLPDIGVAVSLADYYLLRGEQTLANDLLDQSLAVMDANEDHYWNPARPLIYALKGDVPNALQALRANIDANWRWEWYLLESDRAYEILWDEPEFKAMMNELRTDMSFQRAELHAMIESGEIDLTPSRDSD